MDDLTWRDAKIQEERPKYKRIVKILGAQPVRDWETEWSIDREEREEVFEESFSYRLSEWAGAEIKHGTGPQQGVQAAERVGFPRRFDQAV